MNGDAVKYMLQALTLMPNMIGVVASIVSMVAENRGPNEAEQGELDKVRDANHAAIQAAARLTS